MALTALVNRPGEATSVPFVFRGKLTLKASQSAQDFPLAPLTLMAIFYEESIFGIKSTGWHPGRVYLLSRRATCMTEGV